MLGEATLDVSGTFAGEAIRVFILFVAQHRNEDTYKRGRIGYAKVAGDRMMPVRMEYDTAFGVVKGYPAELRERGASLQLAGE
jgi:hypothetical protein